MEKYNLKFLCQDTVGEWIIKLGFEYDYFFTEYYVDVHKKKDTTLWLLSSNRVSYVYMDTDDRLSVRTPHRVQY